MLPSSSTFGWTPRLCAFNPWNPNVAGSKTTKVPATLSTKRSIILLQFTLKYQIVPKSFIMYTSALFVAAAAAIPTLQTASSTPAPRSLVPRLEKLTDACQWPFWISPAGKENKFVATSCRGTNGENVAGSDVDMNQCLANDNGVLNWRWG
jgi:hypothetical protein